MLKMDLEYKTDLQNRLVTWSEWHALVMLIGVWTVQSALPIGYFSILACASFAALIVYCRPFWAPNQTFGVANCITGFRLVAILLLVWFPNIANHWVIAASIAILTLDGVDGYVARKLKLASEFGEYFDKEVDALFMVALCLLLYAKGHFGAWILIPGLLRYVFVLYLKFANPPEYKEYQSSFSKWIFFIMISILIFDFSLFYPVTFILTLGTTLLLGWSFLISILRFYRD